MHFCQFEGKISRFYLIYGVNTKGEYESSLKKKHLLTLISILEKFL